MPVFDVLVLQQIREEIAARRKTAQSRQVRTVMRIRTISQSETAIRGSASVDSNAGK